MVLFMFTVMFLNIREESLKFDAQNLPVKFGVLLVVLFILVISPAWALKKLLSKPWCLHFPKPLVQLKG
jgi:NADH:ubiquinone oxidoreductase subunit 6 (subunit J)